MIILGLGSNLSSDFGDRFKNIDLAINFLRDKNINLVNKSSFYESVAYPNKNDPKFVNIVISVEKLVEEIKSYHSKNYNDFKKKLHSAHHICCK